MGRLPLLVGLGVASAFGCFAAVQHSTQLPTCPRGLKEKIIPSPPTLPLIPSISTLPPAPQQVKKSSCPDEDAGPCSVEVKIQTAVREASRQARMVRHMCRPTVGLASSLLACLEAVCWPALVCSCFRCRAAQQRHALWEECAQRRVTGRASL